MESGETFSGGDGDAARKAAREEALARARALTEAEAEQKEARARSRKRRAKIAQVVIVAMFIVMALQRLAGGDWFN